MCFINEMVIELAHPKAGKIKLEGQAMKLKKTLARYRLSLPLLGQRTDQVLELLGYRSEQMWSLR